MKIEAVIIANQIPNSQHEYQSLFQRLEKEVFNFELVKETFIIFTLLLNRQQGGFRDITRRCHRHIRGSISFTALSTKSLTYQL